MQQYFSTTSVECVETCSAAPSASMATVSRRAENISPDLGERAAAPFANGVTVTCNFYVLTKVTATVSSSLAIVTVTPTVTDVAGATYYASTYTVLPTTARTIIAGTTTGTVTTSSCAPCPTVKSTATAIPTSVLTTAISGQPYICSAIPSILPTVTTSLFGAKYICSASN